MKGYMLDTNVFNAVAAGSLPRHSLAGRRIFASHVQERELAQTGDAQRRGQLLSEFTRIRPNSVSVTAVWDDSPWDSASWAAEDGMFEQISCRLVKLDRRAGKRNKGFNQSRDVRIAEAAIRDGLTLVTNDRNLKAVVQDLGGDAIDVTQFANIDDA
jgi:predicted nucleic acid-binding protein